MAKSNLTHFGGDIPDGSLATPGLWDRRLSIISQNLDEVNSNVASGITVPAPATSVDTSSTNTVGSFAYDTSNFYVLTSSASWSKTTLDGY